MKTKPTIVHLPEDLKKESQKCAIDLGMSFKDFCIEGLKMMIDKCKEVE